MAGLRSLLFPLRFEMRRSGYVDKVDDDEEADEEVRWSSDVNTCACLFLWLLSIYRSINRADRLTERVAATKSCWICLFRFAT